MTQTIKGEAIFKLIVNRQPGGKSKFDSLLVTSTDMSMPSLAGTSQHLDGTAPMELANDSAGASSFKINGHHQISGNIDPLGRPRPQSFADRLDFTFEALEADCIHISGRITSPTLDAMAASMRKAGFTAVPRPCQWEMTRGADYSDIIKKFREELNQTAPAGIIRTRSKEAERLGKLADRYKKNEDLWTHCLQEIWEKHIRQLAEGWVKDDITHLKSHKDDWPGFQGLIKQSMETSNIFAFFGRDRCDEALNENLFQAVSAKLNERLQQEVDNQGSPERLNDDLLKTDLVGDVAPDLRDKTVQEIQRQAEIRADIAYKDLVSLSNAAKKRNPNLNLRNDPAILEATKRAVRAERCANLAGLNITKAAEFCSQNGLVNW